MFKQSWSQCGGSLEATGSHCGASQGAVLGAFPSWRAGGCAFRTQLGCPQYVTVVKEEPWPRGPCLLSACSNGAHSVASKSGQSVGF